MKRTSRILLRIAVGVVITAIVSYVATAVVLEARVVYPKPEMKSTFLQTYDPKAVVKPFFSSRWIADSGVGNGAAGGDGHATFKKDFEAHFAMRSEDQQALMSALTQSIVGKLESSRARIVSEIGNDAEGYQFQYTEGKSAGRIVLRPVEPLDPDHLGGAHGTGPKKESLRYLCPGEIPVEVAMSIEETWTR